MINIEYLLNHRPHEYAVKSTKITRSVYDASEKPKKISIEPRIVNKINVILIVSLKLHSYQNLLYFIQVEEKNMRPPSRLKLN
ncbi:hypothetical protein evm_003153 [Chilo suppressalis]|nr:hypothetical protein evm_003153 [Chilo suppressalis]